MYEAEIATAASAICGEENELLDLLSAAAAEELEHRLKKGITPEDCSQQFITAAALMAAAAVSSVSVVSDEGVDYRAGSVSVTRRDPIKANDASILLRRNAETIMAPYLFDSGFVFSGV